MLDIHKQKTLLRSRRRARIRAHLVGSGERPRLSIKRSLVSLDAQLINDATGVTLFGAVERAQKLSGTKTERARAFGVWFAQQAQTKGIAGVVFDRGGYQYHGRIKAFADGARAGGLEF